MHTFTKMVFYICIPALNKENVLAALILLYVWNFFHQGCQFLQYSCVSPLKRLWLHCEEEEEREAGQNWTSSNPSLQEELWRKAVVWKSIWIPTA